MSANRFELLLDCYLNGEATSAEIRELAKLLRDDSGRRTIFVEHHLLQAQLYKAGAAGATDIAAPRIRSFRQVCRWVVAALVLLGLGAGLVSWIGRLNQPHNQVLSGQVMIDGAPSPRIPECIPFQVVSGAAIRLADGSQVMFDPASQGVIHSRSGNIRQAVELTHGGGTFNVAHTSGSFRVSTPVGDVTSLGTKFVVKLESSKKSTRRRQKLALAVKVTEGSVQVDIGSKRYVLRVGDHRRFENDGEHNNQDDGNQNDKDDGEHDH